MRTELRWMIVPSTSPNAERRTPNAERRTPNAEPPIPATTPERHDPLHRSK